MTLSSLLVPALFAGIMAVVLFFVVRAFTKQEPPVERTPDGQPYRPTMTNPNVALGTRDVEGPFDGTGKPSKPEGGR